MPDGDVTPSMAPTSGGAGAGSWISQHKWLVGGGLAVVGIGAFFLYERSRSNAASSSSTAATPSGGEVYEVAPGSLGAYGSDLNDTSGIQGTSGQPINITNNIPSPSATNTSGSSGSTAAVANPYPVGTRVTANETIVQALYDPAVKGWLDLTSKLGIYGGGGANVSGSAYNPNATGTGRIALEQGGNEVAEYNAAGQNVGTFSVR